MNNLLLYVSIRFGHLLQASDKTDWDFLGDKPSGDKDVFSKVTGTVKDIGASGYQLLMVIGMIGLVFSIIMTAITLIFTSNAQKKEEKKSHAFIICIAGVVIFGAFSIIGFLKSISTGLVPGN